MKRIAILLLVVAMLSVIVISPFPVTQKSEQVKYYSYIYSEFTYNGSTYRMRGRGTDVYEIHYINDTWYNYTEYSFPYIFARPIIDNYSESRENLSISLHIKDTNNDSYYDYVGFYVDAHEPYMQPYFDQGFENINNTLFPFKNNGTFSYSDWKMTNRPGGGKIYTITVKLKYQEDIDDDGKDNNATLTIETVVEVDSDGKVLKISMEKTCDYEDGIKYYSKYVASTTQIAELEPYSLSDVVGMGSLYRYEINGEFNYKGNLLLESKFIMDMKGMITYVNETSYEYNYTVLSPLGVQHSTENACAPMFSPSVYDNNHNGIPEISISSDMSLLVTTDWDKLVNTTNATLENYKANFTKLELTTIRDGEYRLEADMNKMEFFYDIFETYGSNGTYHYVGKVCYNESGILEHGSQEMTMNLDDGTTYHYTLTITKPFSVEDIFAMIMKYLPYILLGLIALIAIVVLIVIRKKKEPSAV